MHGPSLTRSACRVAVATALLLLVPLLSMRFTDEMNWGFGDFVAAGGLLFVTGMAVVAVWRRARDPRRRALAAFAVLAAAAAVWAELAVGLFH